MRQNNEPWIDTRLTEKEMNFLNEAITNNENISLNQELAGNISKSELIEDKDNWFYKKVLKKLTERMFYRNWENFSKYHIEVEEGVSLPEFEMDKFWVNYQKQHEFNPPHNHNSGVGFSFVVFMKIPTHWKEQHALPFVSHSNSPLASDFVFLMGHGLEVTRRTIPLSPEDEGRILFFPAWLYHMVFPFYECEEKRVTISGNIRLYDPNKPEIPVSEYEEKEKSLKILEESVEITKKELEQMKKVGENVGSN